MDNKSPSSNRGDRMRRVANVCAQLCLLTYSPQLSDAQRKAESVKLKQQLKELMTEVWK
jgi:hypothetical protein